MSSSYFVTYGTDRLTFGGSGSVAWEYKPVIPVTRYEYKLWTTPDGSGKSAGTLPSALSAFDEYIVGCSLYQPAYGRHYFTFNKAANEKSITVPLVDPGATPYGFYFSEIRFSSNATNWTVVNNTGSCYWWLGTMARSNGSWTAATYDWRKLACVYEVIGVKYQ